MALSAVQRAELIEMLVANVPATTFAEVVREQRVVADFDLVRKRAPEDLTEARRFIATSVIDAYDRADRIPQLAAAVYRRTYRDDQFAPQISRFTVDESHVAGTDAAKEAAIVRRANTMSSRELREFLDENEAKVCLVAVTDDIPGAAFPLRMGTGFLVGPDTVLTAYHTLKDHILNGAARTPSPGRRFAIFDYYQGAPLDTIDPLPPGSVAVPFATDWLLASNQDMPDDGTFRQPNQDQVGLLSQRLDFALVKLAEPIGKKTRRSSGGARRSWVKLPPGLTPLRQDDRIIIPQHPNGFPQRIDFGRFSQADSALDTSSTRLRYDTETDQGTSGAPCFDQRFSLVGMHNASFRPDGVDVQKNQAIRIERILAAIQAVPGQSDPDAPPVRLWNTSTNGEPRVILGRRVFIDWLNLASREVVHTRSERVYAASVKLGDRGKNHGFGKTFTVDILGAHRRGYAEPMVLLGTLDDPLPESIGDIIRSIGFQLGLDKKALDTMPPRPSADLPSGAPNADKLRKWASDDVPSWFDGVLGSFREQVVDRRDEAKQRIAYLKAGGFEPSQDDVELAQQPTPQPDTRRRWPIAWIVIGNLLSSRLPEEVTDFLAGMVGGKLTEESMPQHLQRLRWIFIGYVPDFLSSDQVTPEELDPMTIGPQELIDVINLFADSSAWENWDQNVTSALVGGFTAPTVLAADAGDPTKRLEFFQRTLFPNVKTSILTIRALL